MEEEIAVQMLQELQLNSCELAQLRGSGLPITADFFAALEKAQRIHQKCKQILQSGHQTTIFEIMEQMALYQETALERLYRWTQVFLAF